MAKSITEGSLGGGALKRFSNTLHMKRVAGKLHINSIQEKEIVDRATKVFGNNGKPPYSISGRKIDQEILNPLVMKHVHNFDRKKAEEVEKLFNLSEHTGQIGNKYSDIVKHERMASEQARLSEIKNSGVKEAGIERHENHPSRLGGSRLEKMLGSMKNDRFEGSGKSGEVIFDKRTNRPIPKTPEEKAHDLHHGGIPTHGAPPSSIDN